MRLLNSLPILLLQLYKRLISPMFPPTCRFTPSCSTYSLQAFRKYNFFKATFLSLKRIIKCHPFHPGGFDPLP
ncbi:MAG: membrane protein insertion efficiency factor YidD [Candidatus Cloacimonetes bacterium]|nr:membrane protein insertion efficiency factor YidD [Candidatus Cloacimonadota bacterium]